MALGTILAINATAQASAAQAAAQEAEAISCQNFIGTFDPKAANLQQQKQYAQCVYLLNPDPVTPANTAILKGGFVLLLIGMVAGGWLAHKEVRDEPVLVAAGALVGALLLPLAALAVAALGTGVVWLFS